MDRVLDFIDGIDIRRELGLEPRKLCVDFQAPTHRGVIYLQKKKKLFDILRERVIVRHPVDLSSGTDAFHIFNIMGAEYTYEEYCAYGHVYVDPFETYPVLICGNILIKE